jgi:hypothetical protein
MHVLVSLQRHADMAAVLLPTEKLLFAEFTLLVAFPAFCVFHSSAVQPALFWVHPMRPCADCLLSVVHIFALQHSEQLIDEFIHFSMGGVYSSFMAGGLKISSWAKRLLLRESSISQAVDTLHTVARVSSSILLCFVRDSESE